jgi:hypothetical protein
LQGWPRYFPRLHIQDSPSHSKWSGSTFNLYCLMPPPPSSRLRQPWPPPSIPYAGAGDRHHATPQAASSPSLPCQPGSAQPPTHSRPMPHGLAGVHEGAHEHPPCRHQPGHSGI